MRLVALVAALLLTVGSAMAQAPHPARAGTSQAGASEPAHPPRTRRTFQERFDTANTTHDGHLTLEQARAGHMVAITRDFAAIDTTQKGYVTVDEIKAHRRAVRLARKAAKQG
jgi:hypothetical protein